MRELPTDQNDVAITRAILKLAEAVGLDVIAEGIETQEQLNFLQGEGCRLIQGYFYGKPEAAEKLTHFFQ